MLVCHYSVILKITIVLFLLHLLCMAYENYDLVAIIKNAGQKLSFVTFLRTQNRAEVWLCGLQ